MEQWSACLSGMQFSTTDQVNHLSIFFTIQRWCFFDITDVIILTILMVTDRTMTATFRAAVPRRMRQVGGSTGETFHIKSNVYTIALSVIFLLFDYCASIATC